MARVFGYNSEDQKKVTKQEFKSECDVNTIVDAYKRGAPIDVTIHEGQFADVSDLGDYKQALEQVMEAQAIMARLPAHIKTAVGDTPEGFVDYVNDPANARQLVDWGLVEAPAEAPAPVGPPVADATGDIDGA